MIDENIDFCITKDGSTGLYNSIVDDIYHSTYGAMSEAVEKFVRPLCLGKKFQEKKEIKVLDICYGIGYNTKAFLDEIIKLKINSTIKIDILEVDKRLVLLSPFIKDGKKNDIISYILLSNLIDIYEDESEIFKIINDSENKKFFEPHMRFFIKKMCLPEGSYEVRSRLKTFLHNIYYHYVSKRYKKPLKYLKNNKIIIKPYIDDARSTLKSLTNRYDIIFLDAFTPAKLPTLWSLEFFMQLHRVLDDNGLLVTYSNSAAVRHAMVKAGFCVGKLYDKHSRACGTIAGKNELLIKNKLDDYDLGLMEINAGVYFCDKNLDAKAEDILREWEERKHALNLPSSSSFIKKYKKQSEAKCTI